MSVTDNVNIFFIPFEKFEIVDAKLEFISANPHGLFTWRRSNQQPPVNGQCVASIEVTDALNGDHSVVLSDRLMSLHSSSMPRGQAQRVTKVLFDGVKAAVQQHNDGWMFVHTKSYTESVSILDKIKLAHQRHVTS